MCNMKFRLIESNGTDPWRNLAAEACMLDAAGDTFTFFLWQNAHTVVIGKNQNPWRETRLAALEADGGKLARRQTGGGAVYHDLGNLNFTFAGPNEIYDVHRQLSVIVNAVKSFGISAEFTGRNDIEAQGRKFSGNAFCSRREMSLHHGTLLIRSDMTVLSKYLQPSKAKLKAKGVESVGSRVVNLTEFNNALTVEAMKEALFHQFCREYGCQAAVETVESAVDGDKWEEYTNLYSSWEWRIGQTPQFETSLEDRFVWGSAELAFSAKNGIIVEGRVYSDALDSGFIDEMNSHLIGCRTEENALLSALSAGADTPLKRQIAADVAGLLKNL